MIITNSWAVSIGEATVGVLASGMCVVLMMLLTWAHDASDHTAAAVF